MNHSAAVRLVMLAVSELGGIPLQQTIGLFTDVRGQKRQLGVPGTSDILALMPGGRFVAIEVKTGGGQLSKQQRAFRNAVEARGGDFILARVTHQDTPKSALAALKEALTTWQAS